MIEDRLLFHIDPIIVELGPGEWHHLLIPFLPYPKGAARVTTRGGFAHAYIPKKTRESIKALKLFFKAHHSGSPIDGPVEVHIEYHRRRPSGTIRTYEGGTAYDPKRPDFDNRHKTLMDGASGILWTDDARVVKSTMIKMFAPVGEDDFTLFSFREIK